MITEPVIDTIVSVAGLFFVCFESDYHFTDDSGVIGCYLLTKSGESWYNNHINLVIIQIYMPARFAATRQRAMADYGMVKRLVLRYAEWYF